VSSKKVNKKQGAKEGVGDQNKKKNGEEKRRDFLHFSKVMYGPG